MCRRTAPPQFDNDIKLFIDGPSETPPYSEVYDGKVKRSPKKWPALTDPIDLLDYAGYKLTNKIIDEQLPKEIKDVFDSFLWFFGFRDLNYPWAILTTDSKYLYFYFKSPRDKSWHITYIDPLPRYIPTYKNGDTPTTLRAVRWRLGR